MQPKFPQSQKKTIHTTMTQTSTPQIFDVPIVYQENRIENMKQMLDTLQHLETVSNNIFNRISQQVQTYKNQLSNVQQRTQQAASRVTAIAGRKQATCVFSPPTYPAPKDLHLDQKPLFNENETTLPHIVYHKFAPGATSLRNVSVSLVTNKQTFLSVCVYMCYLFIHSFKIYLLSYYFL
jgi:hypothetical protein